MREPDTGRHRSTAATSPKPAAELAATPAWMNTSTRPFETAFRPCGQPNVDAALAAHVVDRYSEPGQTELDRFVSSGTTMVEAAYGGGSDRNE
jgi:hypothetical protein